MRLVGVDGCRAGWVLAIADADLHSVEFAVVSAFADAFAACAGPDVLVAVDVPIGLPDRGPRACDSAARKLLGRPRASSVFPVPCRAALGAASYAEASARNLAASGVRLQKQVYNILPKVREVDQALSPDLQGRVRETHPEVIFATLAGNGRGLRHAKRTPDGERERLALLPFAPDVAAIRARLGSRAVARDDVIDAAACLVTGRRILAGEAIVLPSGEVPRDARGLRMEIVA